MIRLTIGIFSTILVAFATAALGARSDEFIPSSAVERHIPRDAIRFDLNNERIVVNHHQSLNIAGPITVELWVRIADTYKGPQWHPNLIGKRRRNNTLPAWCLGIGANRELYTVANQQWLYDNRPIKVNRWHHVAAVFNGKSVQFFINGQPGKKHVAHALGPANNDPVILGTLLENTQNFTGDIGPVRVSTIARYTNKFKPTTYWKNDKNTVLMLLMKDSAKQIKDVSRHNHSAQVSGEVEWISDKLK